MEKVIVLAFFKNLGKDGFVRGTDYDTKPEAYKYISSLRMCETPYCAFEGDKMFDIETYDMTRKEMAEMVEKTI